MLNELACLESPREVDRFASFLACPPELSQIHVWRYLFAGGRVHSGKVLDVACGVGYGTDYLSRIHACRVFGVDLDRHSIAYARKHYQRANMIFLRGDALCLPFAADEFDAITSFETIEHLPIQLQEAFVAEAHRVLKPGGFFFCSTPNRDAGLKHIDHTREFLPAEFFEILGTSFSTVERFVQYLKHEDHQRILRTARSIRSNMRRKKQLLIKKANCFFNTNPLGIKLKPGVKRILGISDPVMPAPVRIDRALERGLDRAYAVWPADTLRTGMLSAMVGVCKKG